MCVHMREREEYGVNQRVWKWDGHNGNNGVGARGDVCARMRESVCERSVVCEGDVCA